MTLTQFEATAAPSRAARQKIDALETQLSDAYAERDHADEAFEGKAKLVVAGVQADPTEGDDSVLYGAMGYTRASEQKTGLTRRKHNKLPAA
jgi:hypothetical protein